MGVFKAVRGAVNTAKAVKGLASEGGVDRAVEGVGQAAIGAIPGASTVDRVTRGAVTKAVDRLGDRAQTAVDSRGGVTGIAQRGIERLKDVRGGKDGSRHLNGDQFNPPQPQRDYSADMGLPF